VSLIAVASAKSSPGASTFAELAVARRPTERRCLLVDCDPAGSEWLLRPGVVAEPGVVTLAMAGRRELGVDTVVDHLQTVGTGLEVLVGPVAARQAASALEILGDRLGAHLRGLDDVDVVADCGRLAQRSPALGVVAAADLVVLVSRPTVSEVIHLAPWVDQLRAEGAQVGIVLVGGRGGRRQLVAYQPEEISDALGAPVLGLLADDAAGAARVFAQPGSLVGLWRCRLVRSMSALAPAVFAAAGGGDGRALDVEVDAKNEEALSR